MPCFPFSRLLSLSISITSPQRSVVARGTQLPVEIWQEIFYHSCIVNLCQGADESISVETFLTSQLTRTHLSLVSKHWNSMILGSPILWSQIIITSSPPSGDYLQRSLRLSKQSVLEVYVNFSDLKRHDQIPFLFSILHSEIFRLGTFILVDFCYWRYALESLPYLFPTNMHHSLDCLQTFHIRSDEYSRTSIPRVYAGTIISPNLTDLLLPSCYESMLDRFSGNPDLALRKVDICIYEGWQTVQLLAKSPVLERLTIRFRFDKGPVMPSDVHFPSTLTTLSLDIHGDSSSGIHVLAKPLYFPGLRDLTFKFTCYGQPYSEKSGAQSLQELVLNKHPNMSSLRLHFLYLHAEMLELFTYLKQLRVLQLYACRFEPNFLRLFCNPDICPRLEEFRVTSRYSDNFFQDIQLLLLERPQFTRILTVSTKLFTRDKERARMGLLQSQFPGIQVVG